jgi:hypothetical protein
MESSGRIEINNDMLYALFSLSFIEKSPELAEYIKSICFYKQKDSTECYIYEKFEIVYKLVTTNKNYQDGKVEESEYSHKNVLFLNKTTNKVESFGRSELIGKKSFSTLGITLWVESKSVFDEINRHIFDIFKKGRTESYTTWLDELKSNVQLIIDYNNTLKISDEIENLFSKKLKEIQTEYDKDTYSYTIKIDNSIFLKTLFDIISEQNKDFNIKIITYIQSKQNTTDLYCKHRTICSPNVEILCVDSMFNIKHILLDKSYIDIKINPDNNNHNINDCLIDLYYLGIHDYHEKIQNILNIHAPHDNTEPIFYIFITQGKAEDIHWEHEILEISRQSDKYSDKLNFLNILLLFFNSKGTGTGKNMGIIERIRKHHTQFLAPMFDFVFDIDGKKYKIPEPNIENYRLSYASNITNFNIKTLLDYLKEQNLSQNPIIPIMLEKMIFIQINGVFQSLINIFNEDFDNKQLSKITQIKIVFVPEDVTDTDKEFVFNITEGIIIPTMTYPRIIISGEFAKTYYTILDSIVKDDDKYYKSISSLFPKLTLSQQESPRTLGCFGKVCHTIRNFGRKVQVIPAGGKRRKTQKRRKSRGRRHKKPCNNV